MSNKKEKITIGGRGFGKTQLMLNKMVEECNLMGLKLELGQLMFNLSVLDSCLAKTEALRWEKVYGSSRIFDFSEETVERETNIIRKLIKETEYVVKHTIR